MLKFLLISVYKNEARKEGRKIAFNDFLKKIINDALNDKATDIHFLVGSGNIIIKFRINENLIFYDQISKDLYEQLVLFIKYKSHMDLNISKSPQSNAFNILINDELMRIRVSTLPSLNSESIVLRIKEHLYQEEVKNLLLIEEQEKIFLDLINNNSGLILITGPTGSGKTTLAYALLNCFKKKNLSIVSIEDPVEHYETGFVQLQVNEKAGINYESGIKEILRHDPDIIFIGEIRDKITARNVIRASLSGHRVISTMHGVSAVKSLFRLLELGISRFELEQTLLLITNQRLVVKDKRKKIILEYLNYTQIIEVIKEKNALSSFKYKKISDFIDKSVNIQVIKK